MGRVAIGGPQVSVSMTTSTRVGRRDTAVGYRTTVPFLVRVTTASMAVALVSGCSGSSSEDTLEIARDRRLAEQENVQEFYRNLQSCLATGGWDVGMMEGGIGIYYDSSGSSDADAAMAAYQVAEESCAAQIGPLPAPVPLSTAEARALYEAEVDVSECLKLRGHSYVAPPSEEVYIETYLASYSGGSAPWAPHASIEDEQALQDCPPTEFMDIYSG